MALYSVLWANLTKPLLNSDSKQTGLQYDIVLLKMKLWTHYNSYYLAAFCVTFPGPTWYWFKERPGVRELYLVVTVSHLLTPSQYLDQVLLSLRVVT